jgi:magnesium transporter
VETPAAVDGRIACTVYAPNRPPERLAALERISNLLAHTDSLVWLDVVGPEPGDFTLIQEEFSLHPLAIEDAVKAHQRPKIEAYGDDWFVVVKAATRDGDRLQIEELAIFAGARYIVTVRTAPVYPLDEVLRRWDHPASDQRRDSGALLYTLLDVVVDGYRPIAEAFEERVERLEAALLGDAAQTNAVLLQIFNMKKELARFRAAVVPMRDLLTPIVRGDLTFFQRDELPYYRDVYDHVALVVDQMDAARDLINNARDTHISIASHRQNEVAKQLTIVATVFLPLTYITGFFGQNFGWMVNRIVGPTSFALLGVGSEIAALIALLAYFRYKRWF